MAPEIQKGSAPSREIRNHVMATTTKPSRAYMVCRRGGKGRGRQLSRAITAMVISSPHTAPVSPKIRLITSAGSINSATNRSTMAISRAVMR